MTVRQGPKRTARNIELYSSAYRTAWKQISPLRKREQPDISLRLYASIRRQLNEGATDPLSIATEAFKVLGESEPVGLSLVPAMAALLLPTMSFLEARIGETGIGIYGTPPCVHCGLPTQALLFSHSGGGLQHQHLVRRDREAPNLILWGLLGSSRARCTEDDNCCSQGCGNHIQDFLFHGSPLCWG
jgi:hypothetical protein